MSILIIDDDELIRMTCRNILKKEGYKTLEADNGNTGIEIFEKEKPALVITDMLMPNKEGLETIAEIRTKNPAPKIIAISGGGNTQNMSFLQLAKKMGADRTLEKPIRAGELISAVKALIGD